MLQRRPPTICRWSAVASAAILPWATQLAVAEEPPFQIVWVVIGEASSASDKRPAHAGRQLFMADDLVSANLAQVKVEQVEVAPVINQLEVGERLCLTQMSIRTTGPGQEPIGGAPLSISVRQDHKQRLGLKRSRRDICLQPTEAGEYPVRLTSMLPARDGTMRGAQVFIRVNEGDKTNNATAADVP